MAQRHRVNPSCPARQTSTSESAAVGPPVQGIQTTGIVVHRSNNVATAAAGAAATTPSSAAAGDVSAALLFLTPPPAGSKPPPDEFASSILLAHFALISTRFCLRPLPSRSVSLDALDLMPVHSSSSSSTCLLHASLSGRRSGSEEAERGAARWKRTLQAESPMVIARRGWSQRGAWSLHVASFCSCWSQVDL